MAINLGDLRVLINIDTSNLTAAQRQVIEALTRLSNELDDAEDSTDDLSNSSDNASRSSANFSRGLGQLGIQTGQFATQLQGGVDVMLAFSQQAPDILFVLGQMMPAFAGISGIIGGVIAVGVAVGSVLMPLLTGAKSTVDDFEKAINKLGESAERVGEDDLIVLSESIAKVAKDSETAARVMIRGGMADALKVIESAADGVRESTKDILGAPFMSDLSAGGRSSNMFRSRVVKLGEEMGLTRDEAEALHKAIFLVGQDGSVENIRNLQQMIDKFADSTENADLTELANNMREFSKEAIEAGAKIEALENSLADVATAGANSRTLQADSSLDEIRRLGETEREAIEREFQERMRLVSAHSGIEEQERSRLMANISDSRIEQLAELETKILDRELAEQQRRQAEILASETRFRNEYSQIFNLGEGALDRIKRQYQERSEWIQNELRLSLDEQRELERRSLEERDRLIAEYEAKRSAQAQDAFDSQITAVRGVTAAIRGIYEASEEQGLAKYAQMLQGITETAMRIITVMQAQAAAQAAGDPTAITPAQKALNVLSIGSLFASIVAGMRGGGRQRGGLTYPNATHRVFERGPELLSIAGKHYLPPMGAVGKVTPLDQLKQANGQSGVGGVNVTVINNTDATVSARSSDRGVELLIDRRIQEIYSSAASGRGEFSNALVTGHDVKRRL